MRKADQAAFDAYAAARWVQFVRVVTLLGTPDHLAADVVRAALARTRREWSGREPIDPDITTGQALLEERRAADAWWITATEQAAPEGQRADLESRLDRLTVTDRAALLLEALLGFQNGSVGGDQSRPSVEAIRSVAATIRVEPFAVESLAEVARSQARTRTRRTAPVLVAIALVLGFAVGSAVLNADRSDPVPEATDPATAESSATREQRTAIAEPNPAPVPWYAQGLLHLDQSTLQIPTVRRAAQLGNGGVVLTYAGELSVFDDLGALTRLADLSGLGESAGFVASNSAGLVAWVEPESPDPEVSEGTPVSLVVHDPTRGIDLLRLLVDPQSVPVAVDARAVFFNQDDQSIRVALGREAYVEAPRREDVTIDPRQLVAAAGPSRVYQISTGRLEAEHNSLRRKLDFSGIGGEVSDDGRYLATRTFDNQASAYGDVRVYDLFSGEELDNGVDRRSRLTIDFELGPEDTISYLLAGIGQGRGGQIPGEEGSERLDLVTCDLSDRYLRFAVAAGEESPERCSTRARIPTSGIATFLGQ